MPPAPWRLTEAERTRRRTRDGHEDRHPFAAARGRVSRTAAGSSSAHKTVRNHVSNIFAKLQVADQAEAIIRAHRVGLGVGQDELG
jgi:hypothetical protein